VDENSDHSHLIQEILTATLRLYFVLREANLATVASSHL
jgi:hypothetical protein